MMRPFFSYYGSKWLAVDRGLYPSPQYRTLVEPFAGSACYALHFHWLDVRLYDLDPVICGIWDYLIHASSSEIMALPLLEPGQRIDDAGPLVQEAKWLLGFNCKKASTQPKRSMTRWKGMRPTDCGVWGAPFRWRIASQVDSIRHWKVENCSYSDIPDLEATWFIDPPYKEKGRYYVHGSSGIDYSHLGEWCASRKGEAVVCEQSGADWMPFRFAGEVFSSQFDSSGREKSSEVVWTTARPRQIRLPW